MQLDSPATELLESPETAFQNNDRIQLLREMLQLEEEKAQLQNELGNICRRLNILQAKTLVTRTLSRRQRMRGPGADHSLGAPKSPRGHLRTRIFASLRAAGEEGIQVRELASRLGVKPVNLHSWFYTAITRYPEIKRVAPSHYVLNPSAQPLPHETRVSPPAKPLKKNIRRTKRGEISSKVLDALVAAGIAGITVNDLAKNAGVGYQAVFSWISSARKKMPQIQKVTRGMYRYVPRGIPADSPTKTESSDHRRTILETL